MKKYFSLNYLVDALDLYLKRLASINEEEKDAYMAHAKEAENELRAIMDLLSALYPDLVQMNLPEIFDKEYAQNLKTRLRLNANNRYSLDFLALPCHLCDNYGTCSAYIPQFAYWHHENNSRRNFVINYDHTTADAAKAALNTLLMNMLLGLPAGKVMLNVFDFDMTGMVDMFTSHLDPRLYHDVIVYNDILASERLTALLEHSAAVMKQYGDLVAYNNRHKEIAMPYEVVILNCYPHNYDNMLKELLPLFKNGAKCGISFIVLNNTDYSLRDITEEQPLNIDNYQVLDLPKQQSCNAIIKYTPLWMNPLLRDVCFEYLNEEFTRVPQREILKQDFNSMSSAAYQATMSEISVTIGLNIETKKEVTVRFNSGDYIHAFILGQSGSGKSVLLNNIITSAINKYAPEDLMLYLMDFKGVEFNRYKGIKHAKAVLVDNSDPQMTLEILRELKEENRERVRLWQAEGVANIDGYNRKHPDSRMPQILFVADECQVMFRKPNGGSNSYQMQREIADIVNIIATQGRSQGIHMLLATQTLDDTDISGQVLNNLTECFLLMSAPADSNRLVPDSSDLTEKQPTGECCYYHKKQLMAHVQTFYARDEELQSAINASQRKAQGNISNGGAYFRGSEQFFLEEREGDIRRIMQSSLKCPVAALGHNIGLNADLTTVKLQRDFSENILFFGVNKEEQTVGVTVNALMSLIISYRQMGKSCQFKVIDCLNDEEARYRSILEAMQSNGLCQIVERNQSGELLQQLVNDICNQCATPTILTIIGSEKFVEMKRKMPLPDAQPTSGGDDDVIGMNMGALDALYNNDNNLDASRVKTYPDALKFILDEGPMQGVHVLLQVDKPENILFEGEYCTEATDKFNHKVILRSENKFIVPLRFSQDIDVESLCEDEERLRAYYYPENGGPQLFTPYLMPRTTKIVNTLTITTTIKWEQQIVQ